MSEARNPRTASTLLALLLVSPILLCAQPPVQPRTLPTLDTILQQLQANLDRYDARVPSFFCDEHLVSQVTPGRPEQNAVTDSTFRLKRVLNPDRTSTLDESREVRTLNGEPAPSQNVAGPSLLSGAFEGGLAVVSLSQRACMNYTLERIKRNAPAAPYIIRFASVLTPQNSADCFLQEDGKGRVLIDPASMQITRMELTMPHHTIIRGNPYSSPIKGRWLLAVDYAPVQLGGETFWMPAAITSRATSGAGTFHQIVWSFKATYRNFHKLEVKSRVLLPSEVPAS